MSYDAERRILKVKVQKKSGYTGVPVNEIDRTVRMAVAGWISVIPAGELVMIITSMYVCHGPSVSPSDA